LRVEGRRDEQSQPTLAFGTKVQGHFPRILDLEAVTSFSADGLRLKHAWRCAGQDKQEISGGSI
jgi:hypothetical protein